MIVPAEVVEYDPRWVRWFEEISSGLTPYLAEVLASAVGCDVIGDSLEYAVSVVDGRIVARAEGFGAARAIAQL